MHSFDNRITTSNIFWESSIELKWIATDYFTKYLTRHFYHTLMAHDILEVNTKVISFGEWMK